jgi:hypothetical protein
LERDSADLKAKAALQVIRGELTMACRSLKHGWVYLHAFETGSEARAGSDAGSMTPIPNRPHSMLGDQTPDEAYWQKAD